MKPKITIEEIKAKLGAQYDALGGVFILAFRGYYKNTFGVKGKNDIGVYDDALIVIENNKIVGAWQFNVDPSTRRAGIASLVAGVYKMVKHWHKGRYPALQIVLDIVTRYGFNNVLFTGRHGINLHWAGENSTGSEGCQTARKSDWKAIIKTIYDLMDKYKLKEITYALIEY